MSDKATTLQISLDASELKKGLTDATNAIKRANSEFAAAGDGTKEWEKSADGLAAKEKQLASILEANNQKMKIYEQQLAQVVQEQGAESAAAERLRNSMNYLQGSINKTTTELKQLGQAGGEAKSLDNINAHTKSAEGGLGSLGAKAVAIGGIIANFASQAISKIAELPGKFYDAARATGEYADNILTLEKTTGMSADKLQELSYASELLDVDLETVAKSQTKMLKTMKSASDGSKTAENAFKKLGISVKDASGAFVGQDQMFDSIIAKLAEMDDEVERDATSMEIFGKSARDLNPLIEAPAGTLQALSEEARNNGAVMTQSALETAGAFDDSTQRMTQAFDAMKRNMSADWLPILTEVQTQIANLFTGKDVDISQLGQMLRTKFEELKTVATELLGKVGEWFSDPTKWQPVFDKILSFVEKIRVKVSDWMSSPDGLPKILSDILSWIINDGIPWLISKIPEIISSLKTVNENLITGLFESIKQTVEKIKWSELGKAIVDGILNGLKDNFFNILSWLSPQLAGIVNLVKSVFGIHSPSKVMAEIGENIMEGFKKGLVDKTSELKSAFKEATFTAPMNALGQAVNNTSNNISITQNLQPTQSVSLFDAYQATRYGVNAALAGSIGGGARLRTVVV